MSAGALADAELFAPPDDATVNRAIEDYARAVREAYGDRVKGIYLFGSRARGDHTPESDADIAVVLDDVGWDFWDEKIRLADLSYDSLMASGAEIQGWPVRQSDWIEGAAPKLDRLLIRNMRRDAIPVRRQ